VESTDSAFGWLTEDQIEGYDTGGYTGDWDNSDGKLAVLHQKELVLNSSDTENILNAVQLVKNMDSLLSALSSSVLGRVSSLTAGLGSISADYSSEPLEQNVKIEATFPNVQSSNEIEEALNNLVNRASQYAYNSQR
jgi:hypothetical protein